MKTAYLFLLAFIAWTMLFWYHYVHNIKQICAVDAPSSTITIPESIPSELPESEKQLLFQHNTYEPVLRGPAQSFINTILEEGNDDQLLQITGYYTSKEQASLDYNLGLARANELKKILVNDIEEDRIELFSDSIFEFTFYKDSLIEAVWYEWVDGYVSNEPLNAYLLNHDKKRVDGSQFEDLLQKIATRLIESGETIIIRGHTDEGGGKEKNFKIALRNAKNIRDVLKEKGVPNKQIKTTAQGEESPIADNATKEGRLENRRIEIEIRP
jgi:hypothetical protein